MEYDLYRKLEELAKQKTSLEVVTENIKERIVTYGDIFDEFGLWDNEDAAMDRGQLDGQILLAREVLESYHKENGGK